MVIIDTYMKKLFKSAKGFTLIELLIVIAVIGILAAVVLAAIDPAEQLRRGRDSSRLQTIATLGHAMAAYETVQLGNISGAFTTMPAATATWMTDTIIASGDIKAAPTAPSGSSCNAPAANCQGVWGYAPNGTDFFIWTQAESNSALTKANNGVKCPAATPVAVYVYDSSKGQAGVTCVNTNTAPAAGITLH